MKVVRKSILQRIEKEVSNSPEYIQRIELSIEEFKEFLSQIDNVYLIDRLFLDGHDIVNIEFYLNPEVYMKYNLSGSYIVYKGVCIQTHTDY